MQPIGFSRIGGRERFLITLHDIHITLRSLHVLSCPIMGCFFSFVITK